MACIFCEIAAGRAPSYKIYEDADSFAFLDINPAAPGHTLVVPKSHAAMIFDIDELSLRRLTSAVKHVADRIRKVMGADVSVLQNNGRLAGQGVDHVHFHVIPQKMPHVVRLGHMGPRAPDEDLKAMTEQLKF
jgi:histidine triad (HIT) family protein